MGSSAGGLKVLSTLLENLPANYHIPIIIVQHRSKEPKDLLEEVLQNKSKLKIKQADEKEKIKSGFVYIAPPDYHLLIESNCTFSLSSDEQVNYSRPSIDVLFDSAAQIYGNQLIGIILTGANNDGARGIANIDRYGGLTIAQSPLEAEYPTMPTAAVDTQTVRYILTLSGIQNFLLNLTA